MDQVASFEVGLAEKLQDLPVPDMADMIWGSIERQLYSSLPGDADGDTPVIKSKVGKVSGNGPVLFGTVMVIAVVILFTYILREEKEPEHKNAVPQNEVSRPVQDSAVQPFRKELNDNSSAKKEAELPSKKVNDTVMPVILFLKADTVAHMVPLPFGRDTAKTLLPRQVIIPNPLPLDAPVHPKQKGVKGINMDDYKIVGTKDSGSRRE